MIPKNLVAAIQQCRIVILVTPNVEMGNMVTVTRKGLQVQSFVEVYKIEMMVIKLGVVTSVATQI